ncbi:YncE family protein [Streptomyces parvulus]|uniref:YncE family protein n=1 Tax=Streptomyces parvulus TaxID=146923 RepID=UPI0033D31C13
MGRPRPPRWPPASPAAPPHTKTLKEKKRVTVEGTGPTVLAVNRLTGTVYAADLNNDQIIAVSPWSQTPCLIPTGDGPISIALSRTGLTAYTADQSAGTLSEVSLLTGKVTRTVPTGAGALSVATGAPSGQVVSRTAPPPPSPWWTRGRARS